jgi:hypothetical protein
MPITYYLDGGDSTRTYSNFKALFQQYNYRYNSTNNTLGPPMLWSATPEPNLLSSTANFFSDSCSICPASTRYNALTCTVAAYWETSEHELVGTDDGLRLVRTAPLSRTNSHTPRGARPIAVDWGTIPDLNSAKFADMILSSYSLRASLLAISLASVISEGTGALQYWHDTESETQFSITKVTRGYGYGTSPASTRLSLVVIIAYCIVTVSYITYLLVSGHASTAWNSATELVLLALQSRHVEHLDHTSVGINSKETYREPVGIRVSGERRLELVFAKDPSIRARKLRRVVPNKAY